MLVSILLPSFRRAGLLALGLASIYRHMDDGDYEVVVLNDGVPDETEAVCSAYANTRLRVRYVFTGKRNLSGGDKFRVPGFALNIGLKACSGEVVVLSCPEVYHLCSSINPMVSVLQGEPLSMVIPNEFYFDVSGEETAKMLADPGYAPDTSKLRGGAYGRCHVEMPFLMAVYKRHFFEIGGYDEDFVGYAGEDCDLVERLKLLGLRHVRVPARAVHLFHGNSTDGGCHFENPAWVTNWNLLQSRKGVLVRNVGREWGVLDG